MRNLNFLGGEHTDQALCVVLRHCDILRLLDWSTGALTTWQLGYNKVCHKQQRFTIFISMACWDTTWLRARAARVTLFNVQVATGRYLLIENDFIAS